MTGTLYLCATPIGNLEDITLRALRILKEVQLIAAEDTRTSGVLLSHYDIHTPLTSYHKFNEEGKADVLIGRLLSGDSVALITDAGTPAISDPGEILVRACMDAGIPVTAVPGPSAAVTALSVSGQNTRAFVFEGFLPPDKKKRAEVLERLVSETRTAVLYEAPHRLKKTLADLRQALGDDRGVSLCRELTKKFETVSKMTLKEAYEEVSAQGARGEYVLVVAGAEPGPRPGTRAEENVSVKERVASYEAAGMERKEAMRAAAKDLGVSKRDVYQELLKEE